MPSRDEAGARPVENPTRSALMDAGERLFARRGIEGPSLRELIAEAGVGNKSALQYHFGTRDGLVAAIVARHGDALRRRRGRALESVLLDDASTDVHRLCEVVVRPYCQFLSDGPSELRYLIIAAEVLADPTRPYEELQVVFDDAPLPRVVELLLDSLELPGGLATERLVVGISQVIAAVATRARQQLAGPGVRDRTHSAVFVANLVDMLHGSITAPVGPATLAALELDGAMPPRAR